VSRHEAEGRLKERIDSLFAMKIASAGLENLLVEYQRTGEDSALEKVEAEVERIERELARGRP
jgi:hypothetical protein